MTTKGPNERERALISHVARAREGDRAALEQVVRLLQPMIARLALRFFGCPVHAEDATQESVVQIITRLDRYDGRAAFTTWAYRVATNKFLAMARSPAERAAMTFETFEDELADAQPPAAVDDELLLAEVRIGCTLAMLLCLEREARMAYILGEIAELDHVMAAEILGCSAAAYRKRLERARTAITGLMRRRCGVFDEHNPCRCRDRVPVAIARGRLNPAELVFATSAEQARQFPEVLQEIRRLDEVRRAAGIYQAHPDPRSRIDLAQRLNELLGSDRSSDQG